MSWLLPLPVAVPLLAAALLAGTERMLSRRAQAAVAIAAAGVAQVCTAWLVVLSRRGQPIEWFSGWRPRHGVPIGIDFVADPLGAGMAALVCCLVVLALTFSWTYMSEASGFFDILMLVFCGAACAFALTGDLFNLFVWFELMGVAAYALSGFNVEELGPVQGAFNFAITNTVGAYLMLLGIGLLYARTGALNLARIGAVLTAHRPDALVAVALTLVMIGFLVKAAVVPFHFWLADAHAVAPAPVCVLFSGVMVELGLFAIARVWWTAFHATLGGPSAVRDVLLVIGLATALVGALMCFLQRHLKRLLAYSTISHAGVMLAGIALLGSDGLAGMAGMTLSHALLKGGLFLACGIVLRRLGGIDELRLRGRGAGMKGLGALMALAALGLTGAPFIGLFLGQELIDSNATAAGWTWAGPIAAVAAGVSSGAILRAIGRVFLGLGPADDPWLSPEPGEDPPDRETTYGLMTGVVAVMVAAGLLVSVAPGLHGWLTGAADGFRAQAAYAHHVLHGAAAAPGRPVALDVPAPSLESLLYGLAALAIALGSAALGLYHDALPAGLRRAGGRLLAAPVAGLRAVHSGIIGDYVAWLALGAAAIGAIWTLSIAR